MLNYFLISFVITHLTMYTIYFVVRRLAHVHPEIQYSTIEQLGIFTPFLIYIYIYLISTYMYICLQCALALYVKCKNYM